MTGQEIVQALHICGEGRPCRDYQLYGEEITCVEKLCKYALGLIERLTAENAALREKQRWIPVTERMPELEVPVLVLDRRGNMIVRTLRRLVSDKEAVFRPDGLAPRKNITHWMPLPEAPEEGEKA